MNFESRGRLQKDLHNNGSLLFSSPELEIYDEGANPYSSININ